MPMFSHRAAVALLLLSIALSGCSAHPAPSAIAQPVNVNPTAPPPATEQVTVAPIPPVRETPPPKPLKQAPPATMQLIQAPVPKPAPAPRDEQALQAVRQSRTQWADKPQLVVLACADFLRHHPNDTGAAEVQAIADQALDRIWWMKLDQLCARRDEQQRLVGDCQVRITAQTKDDETPAPLLQEKASLDRKLADTLEQLRDMHYLSAQRPALSDPVQMSRLRTARDEQVYDWWKKVEIQKIEDSRGAAW